MIDPTRERQLTELNLAELCTEILARSRNELYLNMRFLDLSLSSLGFEADWGLSGYGIATDGFLIYYQPEYLTGLFRKGRILVNRVYLHMVLHCLFGHLDNRMLSKAGQEGRETLWNLSCDVAMELSLIHI